MLDAEGVAIAVPVGDPVEAEISATLVLGGAEVGGDTAKRR
jgi:hypothetical protein